MATKKELKKEMTVTEMGRLGGLAKKTRPQGFATMSKKRRTEISKNAARKRWKGKTK